MMRLGAPELVEREGEACVQASLHTSEGSQTLWFAVPAEHAGHLLIDRADGFLVATLLLAMSRGQAIESVAPVSARLAFNLVHHYQPLLTTLMPQLRPVPIHAPLTAARGQPSGVGSGFSAGVDSFSVMHDHFVAAVPEGFRLTHLLFNNVGSHGTRDPRRARSLFRSRHALVGGWPAETGLPFIPVDSNLAELLPLDFEQTHTTRNLAVALTLQPLLGRFYYASTFHYRDLHVGPTFDAAFADPVAVPLLSTETLDMVAAGSQHSRVTKTSQVTAVPGASRYLNVCATETADGRNCSTCRKCCRTLFTLELLGQLDQFAEVFRLDAWRHVRHRYICTELLSGGAKRPLTNELLDYANCSGHRFTVRQKLTAAGLRMVPRPIYRLGRSLRRRFTGVR